MNIDKKVDEWYAANTDGLDSDIMNAIFTNLAFALIEEEIVDEIRADTSPELDDDFGDVYWNGYRFVDKPGREYSW